MAKRLEGKVAVITGGASGIGEDTARLFVQHGAKVIIGDVQDDLGRSVSESIGSPEVISYVHCNVADDADVQNLVDTAVSKFGKLDIMFSNAGIAGNPDTRILSTNYQEFRTLFDINVFGAFACAKHAARVMIPQGKGSIIFTGSVGTATFGDVPHPYIASKNAIVGLMKNLSVEMGQHGIRANCVSPFAVATPMLVKGMGFSTKEPAEEFVSRVANLKGEKIETKDVAEAVVFLGSDESKYVSGQNLVIDGGYSLTNVAMHNEVIKMYS